MNRNPYPNVKKTIGESKTNSVKLKNLSSYEREIMDIV